MSQAKDTATKIADELKVALEAVSYGHKVKEGGGTNADYVKNAKGSLQKEVGALVFALQDLDSWYSILMSSVVAFVLTRNNYFLKPQGSSFTREFLVFTLYEVLQPKLSSVIPRYGVEDIDTHRYRSGLYDTPEKSMEDPSRRLAFAGRGTLVAAPWKWDLMFAEWANSLPIVLVCMVIVDVGLGKRSDLRSLLHLMFVMLVVSGSRYVKNRVLINNPARQQSTEIFRRAMALGHSFETVPKITYKGWKAQPRLYTYDPQGSNFPITTEKPK